MHIVKFCTAVNQTLENMKNRISYIVNPEKCNGMRTQIGVVGAPYESMLLMKRLHGKISGRQYAQIVFSPDPELRIEDEDLLYTVKSIIEDSFPNFQALISEHFDTTHKHVHVIINSVDCNGRKYQFAKSQLRALKVKTAELMELLSEEKEYEVLLTYNLEYDEGDEEDDEDDEDDESSYLAPELVKDLKPGFIQCKGSIKGFLEVADEGDEGYEDDDESSYLVAENVKILKPGFIPCSGLIKGFSEVPIPGFLPYKKGFTKQFLDDD